MAGTDLEARLPKPKSGGDLGSFLSVPRPCTAPGRTRVTRVIAAILPGMQTGFAAGPPTRWTAASGWHTPGTETLLVFSLWVPSPRGASRDQGHLLIFPRHSIFRMVHSKERGPTKPYLLTPLLTDLQTGACVPQLRTDTQTLPTDEEAPRPASPSQFWGRRKQGICPAGRTPMPTQRAG